MRQDEVYLAIKRKNKASVTSFCSAEAIEVLFCRSPIDEVQAEAQCLGFGTRNRLTWTPLNLTVSSRSPELFFGMTNQMPLAWDLQERLNQKS